MTKKQIPRSRLSVTITKEDAIYLNKLAEEKGLKRGFVVHKALELYKKHLDK